LVDLNSSLGSQADLSPEDLVKTFEAYVKEARRLQEKHKEEIELLVGAETEMIYSESLSQIKELRSRFNLEYLVGSVHHVEGIPIDFSKEMFQQAVEKLGSIDNVFLSYFDTQYELIREIQPEVIGHFDLINMFAIDHPYSPAVLEKIKRNIMAGIEIDSLFEINASGFKKSLPGAHPQIQVLKVILSSLKDLLSTAVQF